MAARRKVIFGRINRRMDAQAPINARPFAEDVRVLSESRETIIELPSSGPERPSRTWIAGDFTLDASGSFMTGLLGFRTQDEVRQFDEESWSWAKGETEQTEGAFHGTVVPFALDLRENMRWLSFATSNRIRHSNFQTGFKAAINQAVRNLGLWPTDWEVDLIVDRAEINEWIREHPDVFQLIRKLQFSNPGLDLDGDRDEMRKLRARRKEERYFAYPGQKFEIDSAEFQSKLVGLETGDAEVTLKSRGDSNATVQEFVSKERPARSTIEEFGTDFDRGRDLVLAALREYVARHPKPSSITQ